MGEPSTATSTSTPPLVVIPREEWPDGDEPPSPRTLAIRDASRRHPIWADVPDDDWHDWRWQSQHAIRSPRQLADLLPFSPEERLAVERLSAQYKTAIPPYYFSLIDPHDPHDPIRLQSVPSIEELEGEAVVSEDDPLDEDKDSPVPGVTHRCNTPIARCWSRRMFARCIVDSARASARR